MELLVKIALIIAIVITVTLFVLTMILSISIVSIIFDQDKYGNSNSFPETFEEIIRQVHNFMIVDTFKSINSSIEPYSTEEMYCKTMSGHYETMILTGDLDIPTCRLVYPPELFWDDLWDYSPTSNTTPIELGCEEANGITLNVPDPLGKTVFLCLKEV